MGSSKLWSICANSSNDGLTKLVGPNSSIRNFLSSIPTSERNGALDRRQLSWRNCFASVAVATLEFVSECTGQEPRGALGTGWVVGPSVGRWLP